MLTSLILTIITFQFADAYQDKVTMTSTNCALGQRKITSSSIRISDVEYSHQTDGINIVVYDVRNAIVLNTASFQQIKTRQFFQYFIKLQPGVIVLGTSQIRCKNVSKETERNFETQESVLYGLRRLGIDIHGTKPRVFSSAVFAFCKESCFPNITSTIAFPFSKVNDFKEGSISMEFKIQYDVMKDSFDATTTSNTSPVNSLPNLNKTDDYNTLYAVIISCSLLICLTICGVSWFFVNRRHISNRTLKFSKESHCNRNVETLHGETDAKCKLLFISKEKSDCYQQQHEPTTSARLFSIYGDETDREMGKTKMNGFATYVKVETADRQLVYKVPSGVSKHNPPAFPPKLFPKESIKTLTPSEYLSPHDYEYAGEESEYYSSTFEESTYHEVDENHEEYISLEPPYVEDEYKETLYDNCSVEYHVPNCEI